MPNVILLHILLGFTRLYAVYHNFAQPVFPPTPPILFPRFPSFIRTPSFPNTKPINTTSATLLDTTKRIRLGIFFRGKKHKETELLIEIPVGVGEAFSSATRVCGWHWWTSRKRIALIEKVKSTWERRWGSFSWRGPIQDTVGWSRWTGGPRNLTYVYCDNWLLIFVWLWKEKNFFHLWERSVVPLIRGAPLAYHVATWWNIPSLESNIGQSRE